MAILLNEKTRVVVQGITGRAGRTATEEMLRYGTHISCGVTPGKSGETVLGVPVFDSVAEAKEFDSELNTSILYVPPLLVYEAAVESILSGMKMVVIIAESVPMSDAAKLIEIAKGYDCRLLGPSSIGVIVPGKSKLGSICGPYDTKSFTPGDIGVISKSGGMCAETAMLLSQSGLGQSTVVGIGGDSLIGTAYVDLLDDFEQDEETRAIVIFGEVGGTYELQLAQAVKKRKYTKPIIAFISGQFTSSISRKVALGHAGAILRKKEESVEVKKKMLQEAGVHVVDEFDDIPKTVKEVKK